MGVEAAGIERAVKANPANVLTGKRLKETVNARLESAGVLEVTRSRGAIEKVEE